MVAAASATLSLKELLHTYHVSATKGLSEADVQHRRSVHGKNTVEGHEETWISILVRQFTSPFLYLLFAAALLTFFLGETVDGAMIVIFVLVNAFLGFYQEYQSHHTMQLLRKSIAARARVIREGEEQLIHSELVVPGDLLVVETGDIIAADIRLIRCERVLVDESVLTGESVQVEKIAEVQPLAPANAYQAKNIAFSGTTVVGGKAVGIVVATGKASLMGEVNKLTLETRRVSEFEKNLSRFSMFILRMIVVTLFFVFLINIAIKGEHVDIVELAIFSIALAVSVIPESLPVVTTFSLSRGALRLARQHVIVKRLSAIEDLGSIDILCTDKTGTLTQNELTLDGVFATDREALLWYGVLAATERYVGRDPNNSFDRAFWNELPQHQRTEIPLWERVWEIPFDPHRRSNTVVVHHASRQEYIIRGAPEMIIPLCSSGKRVGLSAWITQQGKEGKRVLAIARKTLAAKEGVPVSEKAVHGLELVGCASFIDPLKPTAMHAVTTARSLGVSVKILTGDSPDVAAAVAHAVGLVTDQSQVLTGEEWEALPEHQKESALETHAVFARVSPQQKYALINAYRKQHTVGFLGEGINDAPALKAAHIGIVVQDASDIAREAADIVLGKKSLLVIVDGIAQGRGVFANTMKYIRATLSSNFGNFYAVAISSLFIDYLPMLPLQILLVNLLTDMPMIAIAGDTVDDEELRRPKSYNLKDLAFLATTLGIVSTVFDFICFSLFYRSSPAILQTNWFIVSILSELVFLYSIRSRLPFTQAKRPASLLIWLTLGIATLTLTLPYTLWGQHTFLFHPPSLSHMLIIGSIISVYFILSEITKLFYYKYVYTQE